MRSTACLFAVCAALLQNPAQTTPPASGQAPAQAAPAAPAPEDPIATMVARLDLEKYKATIKGLTQFGDRRQGTERNRKAVDWIEEQLKSYGCTNTERIKYLYAPAQRGGRGTRDSAQAAATAAANRARTAAGIAQGGGRLRGIRARTGVNNDSLKQPDPRIRALDAEPAPT